MRQIGTVVKSSGSQPSQPGSAVVPSRKLNDPLPPISNRITDVELPKLWSAWAPFGKPRGLRRELTASERGLLEARRNELAPVMVPVSGAELDAVTVAIASMFASFRSMRQDGENAVGIVGATVNSMREYPAWAIIEACQSIQKNGVWRNEKFDRQWPPNDAEIIDEVRKRVALYENQYRSAVAILSAEVER